MGYSEVWLVDDDEATNFLHKRLISRAFPYANVRTFDDGEYALHALSETDSRFPDLILLDVNMPGMSGYEFLQQIPASLRGMIRVIMLSTYINDAMNQGLDNSYNLTFIEKPLNKLALETSLA